MYTLKLLKRAETELYEASDWYEEKRKGLASRFLWEIYSRLDTIKKNPKLYQVRGNRNLRFSPLNNFPFVIIYWLDDNLNAIFIVSIFHTSRAPFI